MRNRKTLFTYGQDPAVLDVITASKGTGRVPLDKEKGFVKGKEILSGAEHRLLPTSESVGPRLWDITAESLFLVDRSTEPSIRPKLLS